MKDITDQQELQQSVSGAKKINFLVLLLFIISACSSKNCYNSVCIKEVKNRDRIEIYAENLDPFTKSLEFETETDNLLAYNNISNQVIFPNSSKKIQDFLIQDQNKLWRYNYSIKLYNGSYETNEKKIILNQLPFDKKVNFRISKNHHRLNSKYAIDFIIPEGTKVVAVEDGYIVNLEDKFTKGGDNLKYLGKANFIAIVHNDGKITEYFHLAHNSITKKRGDFVKRGEVIGLSGNTGYSTGPHLHFQVSKPFPKLGYISIPIDFE